jgi:gliding motility-associated-like protein
MRCCHIENEEAIINFTTMKSFFILQRFLRSSFFLAYVIAFHISNAQCTGTTCGPNLIPNPSFEQTTSMCGVSGGGILYTDRSPVKDWYGISCSTCYSNGSTPDYKNSNCANADPTQNCGDGAGSVGIFLMTGRESVQAKLTAPLQAGHLYCFSMKVKSTLNTFSCDGIGAWIHNKGKIDVDVMNGKNRFLGAGTLLNGTPQIQNPLKNMIGNTCQLISGTFCANGGEQWVVISNFRTNAETTVKPDGGTLAYFMIDEVSLQEINCLNITTITAANDSVCPGSCTTLTAVVSGGSGTYTYLWSPGGEKTASILACPSSDKMIYKCTVSSSVGCTALMSKTDSVTVYFKPTLATPVITPKTSPTFCTGDSVTLTCSNAPSYSWSPGGKTSSSITVYTSGIYTVMVKHPVSGCNTTSAATIVKMNDLPVLNVSAMVSHPSSCNAKDGSLTGISVSGASPFSYSWNSNPVQTEMDLVNAGAGLYALTVTDKNGCKDTASGTIVNKAGPPPPSLKAGAPDVCVGANTILYVSGADPTYVYTWTNPSSQFISDNDTVFIANAQLKDGGIYQVTATKFGCTGAAASLLLAVKETPDPAVIRVTSAVICEGLPTILYVGMSDPALTYTWTTPSQKVLINDSIILINSKLADAGTYTLIATKANCPGAEAHATLIVNPAPVVPPPIASNSSICEGKSTVIDVLNPETGITYNVYDALLSGTLLGATPFTVVLVKTTTLYVEAQTTKGCVQTTGRIPITIVVNPTPAGPKISVIGSNNNYICDGSSALLTSSIPSGIIWSTKETSSSITVKTAGTYWVYYTDGNGCVSLKDSVKINIHAPPKVDVSNYTIDTVPCNANIGGIHGIVINNGTAPFTYKWYESSDPTKTVSTDLILQGVASGKYTLMVTDKNGCSDQLSNMFIPTKGGIVAHLSSNPGSGFYPLDAILTTNTSGTGKPIDYVWYLDGYLIGTSNGKTNTFTVTGLPFGEHVFQVSVRDTNGCSSIDYLRLFVNSKIHVEEVNIFTPNNDGKNDVLIFPTEGVKELHGKIYDRWGLKLFEWSDMNTGWDGNTDSGPAPDGTYYYIIQYTDVYDGPLHTASGFIQLIRK